MLRHTLPLSLLLLAGCVNLAHGADTSGFSQTYSRSQYVHWIDLYDAADRKIDPAAENPPPYSPQFTCGRCHDYQSIAGGHHFNATDRTVSPGRPGEPWLWTDPRTGTQLPLSYRGWPGTYDPGELGISSRDFVLKFGRHLPGGGPGEAVPELPEPDPEPAAADEPTDDGPSKAELEAHAWKVSGLLNVDCMICHGNGHSFSQEIWWNEIQKENFAWASTAALGIGDIDGEVSRVIKNYDPAEAAADLSDKLPKTTYRLSRVDGEGKFFFDVIRKPANNACYYCHSTFPTGENAHAAWNRDEDVHLRAGFQCADCHSNDLAHHTVRAFEGEVHPTDEQVDTLSCRGCHLNDEHGGGRMGAPKPLHKGLPPLHFDKLSCTACHSGPKIGDEAQPLLTAMAHGLGLSSHAHGPLPPGIKAPVMMREGDMLYPHRMVWPAFWGQIKDGSITPLNPDAVYETTRRTLRVRGTDFTAAVTDVRLGSTEKKEILGEERYKVDEEGLTEKEKAKLADYVATEGQKNWQAKLGEALHDIKEIITDEAAAPVFVSAGKVYQLDAAGVDEEEEVFPVQRIENSAAKPYAWKFGHDVRPARLSLGVKDCYDCHALGTPIFNSTVTAMGQAPDDDPATMAMHELAGYDKLKLDAWALSFISRTAFKYFAYAAMGLVSLILLAYLLKGITSVLGLIHRR